MFDKIRDRLKKWLYDKNQTKRLSFKFWIIRIEIGNFMIAISSTGLMALGVVPISMPALVALAVLFFALGVTGRYIDKAEDNMLKEKENA